MTAEMNNDKYKLIPNRPKFDKSSNQSLCAKLPPVNSIELAKPKPKKILRGFGLVCHIFKIEE